LLQTAGQSLIRGFSACCCCGFATQVNHPGLRWIAQTGIGAALITDLDLTAGSRRDFHFQALAIDRLLAEELIAVGFAFRQHRLLIGGQSVEFQAFLIQVVAVSDLPEQLGFARVQTLGGEYECLVDG